MTTWKVWRSPVLVCCWRDPAAGPETAALHRARQHQAVLSQLALGSIASSIVCTAAAVACWGRGHHLFLVAVVGILDEMHAANVWYVWANKRGAPDPVSRRARSAMAAYTALSALLHGALATYVFGVTAGLDRMYLVGTVAVFIAVGSWQYACLPPVAVAWTTVFCAASAVGLIVDAGSTYLPLVGLLAFFGVVLLGAVLVTSRMFLSGVISSTEIERQRSVLGLLLNDFEENASDWLWETDADRRLRHVSARLAEAAGADADALLGRDLAEVIGGLVPEPSDEERPMLDAFSACLARREPFRDLVVPALVAGRRRWYSLTAKPLLDAAGQFTGWRGVGSDITAVREREVEMVRLATVDALTGLANRHHFTTRLERFFPDPGPPGPCTLILFDLDNFKAVNDSLGHSAGDTLLARAARRLSAVCEPGQLLARLGGDEFALIIPGAAAREHVEHLTAQIGALVAEPVMIDGHRIEVHASAGVASAPADATTAGGLLRAADMALYAAKGAGRSRMAFFEPRMATGARQRLALLSDMREALARGEFVVHYQPQIDLATNRLTGFEALARWAHPVRGLIAPMDFIPLAEDSGLIVELGAWIMERACADAARWPGDLTVAVNVSPRQFANSALPGMIADNLRRSGLPGERLQVEITESILLHDSDAVMTTLGLLRRLGVSIALDDFGTGYSSLAYLQAFPIDKLKIDRSFVRTLDSSTNGRESQAIAAAIVALAHGLSIETIAEGVETERQRDLLRSIDCSSAQGFLYARPLNDEQTDDYLAARFGSRRVSSSVAV